MSPAFTTLALLGLLSTAGQDSSTSWSFDVDVVESCCCDPICPCMVGSKPTREYCRGNRLVEVRKGHYGDVSLDDVSFVLTFDLRKWSKLYFAEGTSEAQVAATTSVLGEVWGALLAEVLETKTVPLKVERTEDSIAFSVPASSTKIEVMRGAGGEPIKVQNLKTFKDYTQYESATVAHTAEKKERSFEYSGTNGFTARFKAASKAD